MKCKFFGLCIHPGLPNATSVQQETNLNYGPFKTVVYDNLKEIFLPSTLPVYQSPLTRQHLGSSSMVVPS